MQVAQNGGSQLLMRHVQHEGDQLLQQLDELPTGADVSGVSPPAERSNLLHDALNALLNLSCAKCAQPAIAREGIWTLVRLWYEAQRHPTCEALAVLGGMAGDVLSNLARHGRWGRS